MKITQNKIGASARQNEETNCVKHQWNQYLRCLKSEIICSKVKKKKIKMCAWECRLKVWKFIFKTQRTFLLPPPKRPEKTLLRSKVVKNCVVPSCFFSSRKVPPEADSGAWVREEAGGVPPRIRLQRSDLKYTLTYTHKTGSASAFWGRK